MPYVALDTIIPLISSEVSTFYSFLIDFCPLSH